MIRLTTNYGVIDIELDYEHAPATSKNFEQYVRDGFYNNTIFHRVIPGFMIQGGGFTVDMRQKDTRDPIRNEAKNGLANDRGTLAMARTQIVDSATCQFFINHADNDFLNYKSSTVQGYGYCVFGKLTDGFDVLDAIATVPTGRMGYFADVPTDPVLILSITRA